MLERIADSETIVFAESRSERKKLKNRSKLIEAALKIAAEKGVEAVTIAEITNRADVGFGSFYNYFSSKEEIMETAVAEYTATHLQIFNSFFGVEEKDWNGSGKKLEAVKPEDFIAFGLRLIIKQAEEDAEWGRFITDKKIFSKYLKEVFYQKLDFFLKKGIKAGTFKITDARAAGIYIGGAVLQFLTYVADGEAGKNAGGKLAELTLRMLGIEPAEAQRISKLPLKIGRQSG